MGSLKMSYKSTGICPTDYSGPDICHAIQFGNCPTDYSGPGFVLQFSSEFVLQIIQVLNLSYIQFGICPTD